MLALEVAGLRKSYGPVPVLRGVSLSVTPGTLTAVLGTSGAGKTTLLRIIAGFEAADEGTVSLGGLAVDSGRGPVPPERRQIGYVPQDGALFPHLTVRGNVGFALRGGARSGRRGQGDGVVADMLDLVGLADLGGRYPHELSGGQQQRVAIARALASRPRLVLLDEPFAALDASLRSTVRADVIGALRATGTTGLLVTHDQDEALSVADCVAVLRDGAITQAGTPEAVYATPADPWTAAFVGTANLLPGVVEASPPGEPRVRTALGSHVLRGGVAAGGAEVTVLVRPEQVTLAGSMASGTVVETRYHGHDAMVSVDVPGVGPLQARTSGVTLPATGDKIALGVDGPVTAWPA
ncbi:MAG TPA: ABC transporter ATP-binding protein [Trebonia sp.]|nr:ABC transporter ATP-binding protein [Trebonia sp.]